MTKISSRPCILQTIDLEISVASARGYAIDSVYLSHEEFAEFCQTTGVRYYFVSPWPKYRGVKVKKRRVK